MGVCGGAAVDWRGARGGAAGSDGAGGGGAAERGGGGAAGPGLGHPGTGESGDGATRPGPAGIQPGHGRGVPVRGAMRPRTGCECGGSGCAGGPPGAGRVAEPRRPAAVWAGRDPGQGHRDPERCGLGRTLDRHTGSPACSETRSAVVWKGSWTDTPGAQRAPSPGRERSRGTGMSTAPGRAAAQKPGSLCRVCLSFPGLGAALSPARGWSSPAVAGQPSPVPAGPKPALGAGQSRACSSCAAPQHAHIPSSGVPLCFQSLLRLEIGLSHRLGGSDSPGPGSGRS